MTHRPRPADGGAALVLVLVIAVLFAVIGAVVLTQVGINFTTTSVTTDQTRLQYGADAGLHWASRQVKTSPNNCGSMPSPNPSTPDAPGKPAPVAMPGIASVTVQCRPVNGRTANTFNGYSVIAGAGYTPPNTNCVSLDSDGRGGGGGTQAQGKLQSCLAYKLSTPGGPSLWTAQESGTDRRLNGIYALDATDLWAVGDAQPAAPDLPAQLTILYSDGGDWTPVATPTNTAGVTNRNLAGVYAADTDHVWVVGDAGTILSCSATCTDPDLATWTVMTVGTANLNAVSGVGNAVWAVGDQKDKQETILYFDGSSWVDTTAGDTATTKNNTSNVVDKRLTGVWATSIGGVNAVWAVGQSGTILSCFGPCDAPTVSWAKATSGTGNDLTSISGLAGTPSVWSAGRGGIVVTSSNGTSWSKLSTAASTKQDLNGLAPLSLSGTNFLWTVGKDSTLVEYDGAAPGWSAPQTPPTYDPQRPDLFAAVATYDDNVTPASYTVWAVGDKGAIFSFTPQVETSAILASITGGKVYNGNAVSFQSGVEVTDGNFEQFGTRDDCGAPAPLNLVMRNDYKYCLTTTSPAAIANALSEPLPSTVPAPPTNPGGCSGTWSQATGCIVPTSDMTCGKYAVFTPGTYTTAPNLKQKGVSTYFFQTGVYYFNNVKFAKLDDKKNNNIWVIGGRPSLVNDTPQMTSPCASQLTTSSYYTGGAPGYGVEWIMGGKSALDVHTAHLELFTRIGGPVAEGAQWLSIREVPPACSSTILPPCGAAGWAPSTPRQVLQIDQHRRIPNAFIHGGIYVPHGNIELYSNDTKAPSLAFTGPIVANSIELAAQTAGHHTVNAGSGGAAPTTFELVAVSRAQAGSGPSPKPFTVQAVITQPSPDAEPPAWIVHSWRVCMAPTAGHPGLTACTTPQR